MPTPVPWLGNLKQPQTETNTGTARTVAKPLYGTEIQAPAFRASGGVLCRPRMEHTRQRRGYRGVNDPPAKRARRPRAGNDGRSRHQFERQRYVLCPTTVRVVWTVWR